MFSNFNWGDGVLLFVNIGMLLFLILEVYSGYKKGFLEKGIRLVGFIAIIIISYMLKTPVSVFLYTNFPFFKFDGIFKGVTALNIIVYEIIAFIIVFIVLLIALKIVCELTKLVEKILSAILFIGLPNKILGALLGFVQGVVILYFVSVIITVGSNFLGYEKETTLVDYILDVPILKQTFGTTVNSLEEITALAKEYDYTNDKEEFNNKTIDVLLKYDIISKENLDVLIDSGKIKTSSTMIEEE